MATTCAAMLAGRGANGSGTLGDCSKSVFVAASRWAAATSATLTLGEPEPVGGVGVAAQYGKDELGHSLELRFRSPQRCEAQDEGAGAGVPVRGQCSSDVRRLPGRHRLEQPDDVAGVAVETL